MRNTIKEKAKRAMNKPLQASCEDLPGSRCRAAGHRAAGRRCGARAAGRRCGTRACGARAGGRRRGARAGGIPGGRLRCGSRSWRACGAVACALVDPRADLSHFDGGYARSGLHVSADYAGCTLQDNGMIITLCLKEIKGLKTGLEGRTVSFMYT